MAVVCGDQGLHHGVLIAAALPYTLDLVARHAPVKAARLAGAFGLHGASVLGEAVQKLALSLGLPATYREAGYRVMDAERLVDSMVTSPFNRTSPYAPTRAEFAEIAGALT